MPADVESLAVEVRAARRALDRDTGRAQRVAEEGRAAGADIARLTELTDRYAKAGALLTTIGEEAQESARAQFEELASQALQAVFGPDLYFALVPGESGGQATLEPVIRSVFGGEVIETPVMDARGGGMAVVIGGIQRLVMVKLTPQVRDIVFFDETFAHVGESYRRKLAEFLADVTQQAGMQVFMITHDQIYAEYADVTARLEPGPDGKAKVLVGESELCRCRLSAR